MSSYKLLQALFCNFSLWYAIAAISGRIHPQLYSLACVLYSCSLQRMKELIEKQCSYRPAEQLLLYENTTLDDLLPDQPESPNDRFPITSDSNPVLLYHCSDSLSGTEDSPTKHHIRE